MGSRSKLKGQGKGRDRRMEIGGLGVEGAPRNDAYEQVAPCTDRLVINGEVLVCSTTVPPRSPRNGVLLTAGGS